MLLIYEEHKRRTKANQEAEDEIEQKETAFEIEYDYFDNIKSILRSS